MDALTKLSPPGNPILSSSRFCSIVCKDYAKTKAKSVVFFLRYFFFEREVRCFTRTHSPILLLCQIDKHCTNSNRAKFYLQISHGHEFCMSPHGVEWTTRKKCSPWWPLASHLVPGSLVVFVVDRRIDSIARAHAAARLLRQCKKRPQRARRPSL